MKTATQQFLEDLNKAFAENNTDFILERVTDDIRWDIVGDQVIEGKTSLDEELRKMKQDHPMELTIHNVITHGKSASVDGVMKHPTENKSWHFCDVYRLTGTKNAKVKSLTSYVVEVTAKPA